MNVENVSIEDLVPGGRGSSSLERQKREGLQLLSSWQCPPPIPIKIGSSADSFFGGGLMEGLGGTHGSSFS